MKSIKKYILIIAAALLTVTLSACKNVTAEEAINKSAEISKNIKNTEFSVLYTLLSKLKLTNQLHLNYISKVKPFMKK